MVITNKRKEGFTLMELLIVLVIVGLLAALVGPALYKRIKPAKQSAARAQMTNYSTALDSFFVDVGRYPTTADGLAALRENSNSIAKWDGPYIQKDVAKDPWGYPFHYRSPTDKGPYEIFTYGADGKEGGKDENKDIYNWQSE